MQARAGLILGVAALMVAPVLPVYGEPPAGPNAADTGAPVGETVLRSEDGTNQPAAFSSVGILVGPGDIVTEAGSSARTGSDEGVNGDAILQLDNLLGDDAFEKERRFIRTNPDGAIIDGEGRLVPGSGVAALVRQNTATGEETVSADPSLLDERFGVALENPASSQPGNTPPGSENTAYDTVIVEVDYHGDPVVTIIKTDGEYRRLRVIKDANSQ